MGSARGTPGNRRSYLYRLKMSVWGYNPLQSDFGLDMRDGVVMDHAFDLEHSLRDIGAQKDLEELHIPLASAAILHAVVSKLGGSCYDRTDVARWKQNAKIIVNRIETEFEYPSEDITACRKGMSSILAKLERTAAQGESGFLKAYNRWAEEKFGGLSPESAPSESGRHGV
ncbi:MAG: hypothetical protein P1U89_12330 [Verrucomicrobiales bacterium]|nr:hypothetical protein [Verrucomicrobiales bacterium]